MTRSLIRVGLVVVFGLSVFVVIAALRSGQRGDLETWAAVAAALAVLTAVLSSWSAQRVLELQEDQSKPYPYPTIDSVSRYGLLQLRVTNYGGGVAHDIRMIWDNPLTKASGAVVTFSGGASGGEIAVLMPRESIATLIDGHADFFAAYKPSEADYSGVLHFRDASGHSYQHRFRVNVGQYAGTLLHSEEAVRTHFELQRIPERLDLLTRELRNVRETLKNSDLAE